MIFLLLISAYICQQVTIGNEPSQVDQTLSFTLDDKSLRIKFCQKVADDQKGILKKDFNYPYPLKFIAVNQNLLQQYITSETIVNVEQKSALIYFDDQKCKQYTIYNYNTLKYEFESNNIKNRIQTILKHEKKESTFFKDCQNWNYLLKLNSKYQEQSINLECNEQQETQLNYEYERTLIGAGLHQFIETKITFNQEINSDVVIIDELDTFTYVDKDELDKLPYETKLMTVVDIERPNELSTQHIVLSKHKGKQTITYLMPYHFRYHLASNQHFKTSYVPNLPRVFIQNKGKNGDPMIKAHFSGNYDEINPQKYEQHLIYEIPVGYLPYKNIVFVITVGLTLGIAMHLTRMMMNDKN